MWHWVFALVDQALVSGTRFLATILVGRFCGPSELGTYSLAFSLLVFAGCIQEALITTPYAILAQRLRRRSRATYAGAIARMHLRTALGTVAILAVLALIGFVLHAESFVTIALVLALTLPASLAAEFVRRFALAQLEVRWAVWLDAAIAALQLVSLLLLAQVEWLNARVALLAVGAAFLLPAMFWWILSRKSWTRSIRSTAPYWRRNWLLGRWLVASQMMAALHGLLPAWLLAMLVDTHATGEFVACLNLALLTNPLIFGVTNLLTPQAARALSRGGPQDVQRVVFRVLRYLVSCVAAFALALALGGHHIIQWIYGASFAGSEKVAAILGLTAVAWAISATFASGLAALGRPRWGFLASGLGTIVTAIGIVLLTPSWSVYGTALGLLMGSATAAAVHAWGFIHRRASQDVTHA